MDTNKSLIYTPTPTKDNTTNINLDDIRRTINDLSRRIEKLEKEIKIKK